MLKYLIAGLGVWFMAVTAQAADLENTLYMELKDGRVIIEMRPDLAPNHVKRIKELVRQGFYDGIVFHRVIDGFMAQTGDPTGTGMGGSGQNIDAEFSDAPHLRGVVSMARPGDINGADSQFFIMLADQHSLDGQYTVWGKVVEGMEYVDNIKKGSSALNGKVDNPDKIISMKVAADVVEPQSRLQENKNDAAGDDNKGGDIATSGKAESSTDGVKVIKVFSQQKGKASDKSIAKQEEIRPENAEPAAGGQKVIYIPSTSTDSGTDSNKADGATDEYSNESATPEDTTSSSQQ